MAFLSFLPRPFQFSYSKLTDYNHPFSTRENKKDMMANQNHLKILKQGIKAWNQWRMRNRDIEPDLEGTEFYALELGYGTEIEGLDLWGANLRGADLSGANLARANLWLAKLSGVKLNRANLRHVALGGADLRHANLEEADLWAANLSGANLKGANLRGANLSLGNLLMGDLSNAELQGANLSEAQLRGADLTHSRMNSTILGANDLSQVKGLETVGHEGPSTIGIDTVYRSKGKIPEAFLRGAGVPDVFVINMKSIVAAIDPIQFYSCFISYSSKDQEFTERLHADLQSKGVRCWFAPEDLKIGDKLRASFDEAIRIHDKLMVVLSESSVKSSWVEKEVETAFEQEHQQNRTVLFPIRLDEVVMETKQAWAADIRRTRHIGDFRNWKDHDSYKKAVERLLRDLKSEVKVESAVE
jgi:uncharacterized protein YjbI with pentapeptide repeats